jgi:methyl-accepting chemotaxis protein
MVEEHTQGVVRTLRVIADSDEAKSGKWEAVKPLLARFGADLKTDATAWYVLPDGSYYETESGGLAEQTLRDRPYFSRLMSGGEVFGDLVISKSTGHRSVILAVPVTSHGGKAVGGVGVSLRVRLLSELVANHLKLPENEYFYALERDSRIVLHQRAERMFKTPSDVGDEALGEEFKRILEQQSGAFQYTLEGKKVSAIFERSPDLQWHFFIARRD